MRNKKIAFIDGENIGLLSQYSYLSLDYKIIYYFLGAKQRLHPELLNKHSDIRIVEIDKTGKNNLDFHLAIFLGRLHEQLDNDLTFEIISNDTGFDGIISFINENWNRNCVRSNRLLNTNLGKIRKIHAHFICRYNDIGLPKSITALHNYLIAKSLSTHDNVYEHIDILFNECGLYLDFKDQIKYDNLSGQAALPPVSE